MGMKIFFCAALAAALLILMDWFHERYVYMDDPDYRRLKDMGVRFQLNLSSLAGFYGKTAQAKAEKMLKSGYYNFTGTDLHNRVMLEKYKSAKVSSKVMERLKSLANF